MKFIIPSWLIIFVVGTYDLAFAIRHFDNFSEWEQNNFAVLVGNNFGIAGLVVVKYASLLFAFLVSFYTYKRNSFYVSYGLTIGTLLLHLWLVSIYLGEYLQ